MADPRIIIPPPCEPISLNDAKLQLRVDTSSNTEDPLISSCIAAARTHIENWTRRQMVLATFRLTLDVFPPGYTLGRGFSINNPIVLNNPHIDDNKIILWGGPIQAVSRITYYDSSSALQTLGPADYLVDLENDPGRILPAVNTNWPTTQAQVNSVIVEYSSGYMLPFTANATSNTITVTGRALETGQAVRVVAIDGTLPGGLSAGVNYYAVNVSGSTCGLSVTPGGSAVDFTTAGTGTLLIDQLPDPLRHAVRILTEHFYDNRGEVDSVIPSSVGALLTPYKCWRF